MYLHGIGYCSLFVVDIVAEMGLAYKKWEPAMLAFVYDLG